MQALPFALFIVMLELTVGSFVSLYLLDLRGDTSRGFVVFQGVLYLVFGGLTLLAMSNFASPSHPAAYGLDAGWLRAQGPLALVFTLLMLPWNVLLWRDRPAGDAKGAKAKKGQRESLAVRVGGAPPLRKARFAAGALASFAGLAALFVVAMGYRTLAASRLDGTFVVIAFLAGGIALGGVMTAMLLGHWYLNTPTASGKPLEFVTALLLGALAVELLASLLVGPATVHAQLQTTTVAPGTTIVTGNGGVTVSPPTVSATPPVGAQQIAQQEHRQAPLGIGAMAWLQFIMGLLAPLVLGAVALYLTRG
ncbi:MAG TPA: hypothetical protein VFU88_16240, partial [Ktedonobacterales bacterium]|nr:hypothetical protein [Ktedonobacterales bacterium]